jgi:6-phosphofructokinase 2
VGAGDSMVAGITHFLQKNKSMKEAIRFGVACGSAATMNDGSQLFHKEDAERLFETIK